MDVKEAVYNTLKEAAAPMKNKDVQELTGLGQKEIAKAFVALKKDGKVTTPKPCFYLAK